MKLIEPGQLVVDLGAAPGAWSQYLRRRFAPKAAGGGGAAVGELNGTIIALDLLPIEPIEGVQFIQGDFREDAVLAAAGAALVGGGRSTWWCPTWRPTCRASQRPTPPAWRTWSNWRSNSPAAT